MLLLVIGQRRKERLRRLVRRLALGLLAISVTLLLTYTAFRRWTLLSAPVDDASTLPAGAQVKLFGTTARVVAAASSMEWRDGIWRLDLSGDPRMIGHSHGLLAGRVTEQIERHMLGLMGQYLTSPFRRWLAENVVRWRFRNIPRHIPPQRLVELAAYSRTISEVAGLPDDPFHRLVLYHALHDITQRLDGSPLVGCTAFATWGKKTVEGRLIVGRNFDFEGGEIFDRQKAVLVFRPADAIPFVSVAWPGMMGVVTGVNARRLYVSINAARTDERLQSGVPMALLVREILEQASSIKEAIDIIRRHDVMVAEGLLIADGKVPDAVVVELSPKRLAVRRSATQALGLTNHFLDAQFNSDASNDWLRRYTTSEARYRRLLQLLERFGGRIDAPTAAMILRNRTAIDDEPLALGNRNALDALIATHGVVVDVTQMVLWVSRGPHLLGAFVPVDLKPIFGMPINAMTTPEAIPPDPLLDSAELARHTECEEQMSYARRLWAQERHEPALDYARRAAAIEPLAPDARRLVADLLWELGRFGEAKRDYQRVLELHPPYLRDTERVRSRLAQ